MGFSATPTIINILIGVSATVLTFLVFKTLAQKEKIPKKWEKVGRVKGLFLYPLKSGMGCSADSLFVTSKGVKEIDKTDGSIELKDRSFLIYTSTDKEVRTARQIPKSVQISIQASVDGVILSAPNKIDLYVDLPKVGNEVKVVSVWGSTFGNEAFVCTDCGENAAIWLSNFLLGKNEGLRLGYGDGSQFRDVLRDHKKWAEHYTEMDNQMTGIFSDLAALHLVNDATIKDLNDKLAEDQKITVRNFRPNILIEGPAAFEEDQYKFVKIGNDVVTKVSLECLRCIETTVSEHGEMNKQREPLKTLESYRKSEGPFKYGKMGIYLRVISTGRIQMDDPVYVSR